MFRGMIIVNNETVVVYSVYKYYILWQNFFLKKFYKIMQIQS